MFFCVFIYVLFLSIIWKFIHGLIEVLFFQFWETFHNADAPQFAYLFTNWWMDKGIFSQCYAITNKTPMNIYAQILYEQVFISFG